MPGKITSTAIPNLSIEEPKLDTNVVQTLISGTRPFITSIQYALGSNVDIAGGETLTISGVGFHPNANVYISNIKIAAGNITRSNATTMQIITQPFTDLGYGNSALYIVNPDGGVARLIPSLNVVDRRSFGYVSGGSSTNPPTSTLASITRYPFATNQDSVNGADLSASADHTTGQSSTTSGYNTGKRTAPGAASVTIDRFPFATNQNATAVGNLSVGRFMTAGVSSSTSGYNVGGNPGVSPTVTSISTAVDRFPFATNQNATNIGTPVRAAGIKASTGLQHRDVTGYHAGGYYYNPPTAALVRIAAIGKFPFATNRNVFQIASLSAVRNGGCGISGMNDGYVAGGEPTPSLRTNIIDKYSFASEATAVNIGTLSDSRAYSAGSASADNGYIAGGEPSTTAVTASIDRFPFATNQNATSIANLAAIRSKAAGHEY